MELVFNKYKNCTIYLKVHKRNFILYLHNMKLTSAYADVTTSSEETGLALRVCCMSRGGV